jgi:peptide/nickel transport system substrate-binding protein
LLAAACGDDDEEPAAGGEGTEEETPATEGDGSGGGGGDLVLGAEQEPECADWISICSGASWGFWTMQVNTMPRSFDIEQVDGEWEYVPSILLTGEPELVEDPQQVVTYSLNPDAVWSDGEPITCDDFVYTWDQVANGTDIYDTTGYRDIESVECTDPQTPVVTFGTPYAGWKALFGGQFGIMPSHLLEGNDRNALMNDGYDFSGGPWIIEEWARGESVTLVPNENYWGTVPSLDSVTFRFITDSSAEFEAFTGGEVLGIFPQPQIDSVEQVAAGIDGAVIDVQADSPNIEALWINNSVAPFDSVAVRQAFAFALDRDAIVERLFGGLGLTEAVNSFNAPILGSFGDPDAFAGYTQDLDQVTTLMEGDGWTRGADGIWEKDGQRASVVFKTTAGNARRELTQDLIVDQAAEAGFEVVVDNQEAGDLFGTQLPAGDFQLALYAQVLTSLEPSVSSLFVSTNIPSEANGNAGQNWTRTIIPDADAPLLETDTNPNEEERSAAMAEADALLAEAATSIPLDPLPNIMILSEQIQGEKINHPIFGPFFNMEGWTL